MRVSSPSTAGLPKHKPYDVYHEGLNDKGPRERFAYLRQTIALRLPVEKYAKREDAGREGKRRLGAQFARCRYFRTARFWVFLTYE